MNIILLSGGSGKRLWPLSNEIRSKQFIKIFRRGDESGGFSDSNGASEPGGTYESMVQRVYRQIRKIDSDAKVTIATSRTQVSDLLNQLGDGIGISVEPCRRDTFPAIALATAYLHDVMNVSEEEAVVVCPVDPFVDDDYFAALKDLGELATKGEANLSLMGIEPTYPAFKYGYIIPETKDPVSRVSTFKEKPDTETAKKYIAQGALWNGGVFAYRLGYVLRKAHELIDFTDYQDLFNRYETLKKISFDYAVVEGEKSISVMRFAGQWKDLGTWNTLTEAMSGNTIGKAVMDDCCENVHVVNDLDIPVIVLGMKDAVVAASPDGILVSDKERSGYVKDYVEKLDEQVRFAEKSWGEYRVLDMQEESETVRVTVHAGHRMSYHSHHHRDEMWTIISGKGRTIVDGMEQSVEPGDVITMQAGCRHTVIADTELQLIEVQIGRDISSQDKIKYELEG